MDKIINDIRKAKTLVVKVGTSSISNEDGKLQTKNIAALADALSALRKDGRNVILISSGAIGVGCGILSLKKRPESTRGKQAAAAVGQCELMAEYSRLFMLHNQHVGQMLITEDVLVDDKSKKNVINTFNELFSMGVIPIVNENDSVSTREIKAGAKSVFNENDMLAAIVAKLIKADVLVMLSDVDGFYDGDPKNNSESKIISVIREFTPEVERFAGGAGSMRGTGGMVTKLRAAKTAKKAGIHTVLTNGENPGILSEIFAGLPRGTIFVGNRKSNAN